MKLTIDTINFIILVAILKEVFTSAVFDQGECMLLGGGDNISCHMIFLHMAQN